MHTNIRKIALAAATVVLSTGGGAFAMKAADHTTMPPDRPGTGERGPTETKGSGPTGPTGPAGPQTPQVMTDAQIVERRKGTVVRILGEDAYSRWSGSGVIIDAKQGLVLTNAHVVAGASTLKATFDGKPGDVPVQPFSQAPCDDLAIVKLTTVPAGLQQAELGDSAALRPMDSVVALGYPGGLEDEPTLNPTSGAVSKADVAANPDGSLDPELPEYAHVIQHTAPIDHGNSGGPLFNQYGQVIGINALGMNQQAWAITSDYVKAMLPDMLEGKSRQYAGWGLWTTPHAAQTLADYGFGGPLADGNGLFVTGVDPNSPARTSDFRPGDVILSMNDKPVNTVAETCDVLASTPAGGTVPMQVRQLAYDKSGQPIADAAGLPVYETVTWQLKLPA